MKLVNPIPLFSDGRGGLLDAGYIYIGAAGTDPEVEANQIDVFWDKERTVPAAQPLRTLAGEIVQGGNLGLIYFAETNFSITKRDADGRLITYIDDAFDLGATEYQPLDSDLTAIASSDTQVFGRSLLTLTDAAALRTAAGLGNAATLVEATAANIRANSPDRILTTDQVWGAAVSVVVPGAGGSFAIDFASGLNFAIAMDGNYSLSNPTNVKDGQSGKIEIFQDATGSRTLTYGSNWLFSGGTDPVLSTAANSRDVLFYQALSDGKVIASLVKAVA
jgi:hypothetical protein